MKNISGDLSPDCVSISEPGLTQGRREAGHHGPGQLLVRHEPRADVGGGVLDHQVRVRRGVRL